MNNKKLTQGMCFDNLQALCDYLGWQFNGNHPDRIKNKLQKYLKFHKEGKSKIVIDDVFCDSSDMIQPSRKSSMSYIYNVGEIINVTSGKLEIIEQSVVVSKSGRRRVGYKCKCLTCGYEFESYESNIKKRVGCGCCAGKVVVKGINDLWTTLPDIAALLANPEDGYKFSKFSSKKADFVCPICGNLLKDRTIRNISNRGLACSCMNTKSYSNRIMYWVLRNLGISFEDEKTFDWSDNKRYDFYIPSLSCIIEMNGLQHYAQAYSFTGKTLDEQKLNDQYKYSMAIQNGIKHYIIIDCRNPVTDYIKNNILDSELRTLLPINKVDWSFVIEKSNMSLIIAVAEKWNNGCKNLKDIAKHIGFKTEEGVRKYIRLATDLGYICEKNNKEYNNGESFTRLTVDSGKGLY